MLKIKGYHSDTNIYEKFFIERCMELLYDSTAGTYRVRVMNPLNILLEFREVLSAYNSGKLTKFEYNVEPVKKEIQVLLDEEDELVFKDFTKRFFYGKIMSITKNNINIEEITLLINKVIENNDKYLKNLYEKINQTLKGDLDEANHFTTFKNLNRLTGYFITQLMYHGYSQRYLFDKINAVFISKRTTSSFSDSWNDFKKLESKKERAYVVSFKLNHYEVPDLASLKVIDSTLKLEVNLDDYSFGTLNYRGKDISKFIQAKDHHIFKTVKVKAFDFHSALHKAKQKLSKSLDIINLGYHDKSIRISSWVLVFEEDENEKWDLVRYATNIDGFFDRGSKIFEKFTKKINNVLSDKRIDEETKEKVESAIRYLRMANDAIELEHMFINYWIAIEHLYSFSDSSSAIGNLKKYLNASHGTVYLQKNLHTYFKDVKRLKVAEYLNKKDYKIFKRKKHLLFLWKNHKEKFPLASYRGFEMYLILNNLNDDETPSKDKKSRIHKHILIHVENLERHIQRIYRTRNQIVHEAAINNNIRILTGNIKYYIIYTLNAVLGDIDKQKSISSIREHFHYRSMLMENIKEDELSLDDYIKIPNFSIQK